MLARIDSDGYSNTSSTRQGALWCDLAAMLKCTIVTLADIAITASNQSHVSFFPILCYNHHSSRYLLTAQIMDNQKAVLSQRWLHDASYTYQCLSSLHRVELESCSTVSSPPHLCLHKIPHVPLGISVWPLGYEERRCRANCPCNKFPRFPTYVIIIRQWDRQTDVIQSQDHASHYSPLGGENVMNALNARLTTMRYKICTLGHRHIEKQ